jgi:quercetin dioxygenase-like cupin family protein
VVLRGAGQVRLGEAVHAIGFGDTVYVAPNEAHQFRNLSESEPLGFLCVVDAERDAPVLMSEKTQQELVR